MTGGDEGLRFRKERMLEVVVGFINLHSGHFHRVSLYSGGPNKHVIRSSI